MRTGEKSKAEETPPITAAMMEYLERLSRSGSTHVRVYCGTPSGPVCYSGFLLRVDGFNGITLDTITMKDHLTIPFISDKLAIMSITIADGMREVFNNAAIKPKHWATGAELRSIITASYGVDIISRFFAPDLYEAHRRHNGKLPGACRCARHGARHARQGI